MPATPATRRRSSSAERREALVEAAVHAFAQTGLHGTAVSTITDAVGVTQPYAFSLFGTKKQLFLAAVERCFGRVEATFRAAVDGRDTHERLLAMGEAYIGLLADRDVLLLQLQAYAACGDDEVREVVRRCYMQLYRAVGELSGAGDDKLREFFKEGMLLNVAAATELRVLGPAEARLSEPGPAGGGAAAGGGTSPG
jgi:AcrR family transcriptional regulator